MKLPYTSLAIAGLSAMITTLAITTTARYATEHQNRSLADAPALPTDRCCCTPTLTQEANASIIYAITRP